MASRRTPTPQNARKKESAGRGRPPVISRERLLEVAREVFLERGVRATTAEVADRAGVSEGTVFHRFKSKDALFREAMHLDLDEVPQLIRATLDGIEDMEIREALIVVGTRILDLGRVAMPLMMMTWSNPDNCGLPDESKRAGFREMLKRFAAFFESKMLAGQLRRVDAEIFARCFVGSLHQYCMAELTRINTDEFALPEGIFVRGLVDLLLQGAAPPQQEIPTPAGSARRLVR